MSCSVCRLAFSPDQGYTSVKINSNRFSARTFRNNTIERKLLVSHWLVACIPPGCLYMHTFDCTHALNCAHASCITGGAVFIEDGSNVFFGGETVFANNTAGVGGTTVTCTWLDEPQMTANNTSSRKRMFW